jgi:ABC-type Mn2+/Zn2+ transport system ATPase subunit
VNGSLPQALIDVIDAEFGYGQRAIVRAGSLCVQAGRCLGLYGPNGVGKSTLVRGMVGLLLPLAGRVQRRPGLRIGYVPQHRAMELHWPMTGEDVASLSISAHRRFGWVRSARPAVRRAMAELGVEALSPKSFSALSGGQQQRLILAGALADDPGVLVLDEPTDGLDVANRALFIDVLRQRKLAGMGLVLISHELEDLVELADEVAWIHPGEQAGMPGRVELVEPGRISQTAACAAAAREA